MYFRICPACITLIKPEEEDVLLWISLYPLYFSTVILDALLAYNFLLHLLCQDPHNVWKSAKKIIKFNFHAQTDICSICIPWKLAHFVRKVTKWDFSDHFQTLWGDPPTIRKKLLMKLFELFHAMNGFFAALGPSLPKLLCKWPPPRRFQTAARIWSHPFGFFTGVIMKVKSLGVASDKQWVARRAMYLL